METTLEPFKNVKGLAVVERFHKLGYAGQCYRVITSTSKVDCVLNLFTADAVLTRTISGPKRIA
jgi:hypothetical protein